ncbi:MAG: DUF4215 domain-containing protein [Candidatus Peribacteraceae bacterium]|nr:DUF4215 domain-containing protein [Candidatus Peribacteraceae bacterium]
MLWGYATGLTADPSLRDNVDLLLFPAFCAAQPAIACGNGTIDAEEECDDGNAVNDDICSNTCKNAVCGNGMKQGAEECDDGNQADEDGCTNLCSLPACGDGIRQGAEECDDKNTVNEDGCTTSCKKGVCGDGFVQSGEECDDGNAEDGDACTSACKNATCGDGFLQNGEECDDGNKNDTDDCTASCRNASCGDGFVQSGEECDGGNGDACTASCKLPRCGDGLRQGAEECDDGNVENRDTCTNACKIAVCGDGFMQNEEECDEGNLSSTTCSASCKTIRCGDGVKEGMEECDDKNFENDDACTNMCKSARCGDGFTQNGEECDDGNDVATDSCSTTCKITKCGDGIMQGTEECDDGNAENGDTCSNACKKAMCGDGFTQSGEECDDGNTQNEDTCTNACKKAMCGDNIVQPGEACDDGNMENADGCTNACGLPRCGDAIVQQDEECDDGNNTNDDTCSNACKIARCGDGIMQGTEECDDGNAENGDTCSNACKKAMCGDGFTQSGEECDDGNRVASDACSNECRNPVCGNGLTEAGEGCDDGNLVDGDGCSSECQTVLCGNGIKEKGEECDDGNATNGDGCSNGCKTAVCGDGLVQQGEECDDGNRIDTDTCINTCKKAMCGDGFVGTGEECDDGNATNGDSCTSRCEKESLLAVSITGTDQVFVGGTAQLKTTVENRGAGTAKALSLTLPLDANDTFLPDFSDTSCSPIVGSPAATCAVGDLPGGGTKTILLSLRTSSIVRNGTYGASIVTSSPTASGTVLASPAHLLSVISCGNGVVDAGEDCDDGNTVNTDTCTNKCGAAACGDGYVQAEEECDDGNATNDDGCSSLCTMEAGADTQVSPFAKQPLAIPDEQLQTTSPLALGRLWNGLKDWTASLIADATGQSDDSPPPPPATATAKKIVPGSLPLLITVDDRCRRTRMKDGQNMFFDGYLPAPPPAPSKATMMEDAVYDLHLNFNTPYDDLWKHVKEDSCIIGITVPGEEDVRSEAVSSSSVAPSFAYLDATHYTQARSFFQNALASDRKGKVVVATIDTGFDLNNPATPELSPNLEGSNRTAAQFCHKAKKEDCPTDEAPDDPQDAVGHGTAVGSLITMGQGSKVQGLASVNAVLLPIKIARNATDMQKLRTSDLFEAIKHAVNAGADVINISMAEYDRDLCNPVIGHAIYKALENNVFFVFSAGNGIKVDENGQNIPGRLIWPSDDRPAVYGNTVAPACWGRYFQGAVTVGGLETGADRLYRFSNYGDAVELLAPATNIASYGLGNAVAGTDGTSVAAPQVSAAAALVIGYFKQHNWYYDSWLIEDVLENAARKVPALEKKVRKGRVLDFQQLAEYLHSLDGMTDDQRRRIPSDNPRASEGWKPDEDVSPSDRLIIQPDKAGLFPGETTMFHAVLLAKDGTTKNVTMDAFWTTQDDLLLPIAPNGQVTLTANAESLKNLQRLRIIGHYEEFDASFNLAIRKAATPDEFVSEGLSMIKPGTDPEEENGSAEKPFKATWGKAGFSFQLVETFRNETTDFVVDYTPEASWTTDIPSEFSLIPPLHGFFSTVDAYGGKRYTVTATVDGHAVSAVIEVQKAEPGTCLGREENGPSCILNPLGKSVFRGQTLTLQSLINVQGESVDRPARATWTSLSNDLTLQLQDSKETKIQTASLTPGTYTVQATVPFRGQGKDETFTSVLPFTVTENFDRVELMTKKPLLNFQSRALFVLRRYDEGNSFTVIPPADVTWQTSDPVRLPIDEQGIVYPSRQSLTANGNAQTYTVSARLNGQTKTTPIRIVPFDTQTGQTDQLEYIEITGIPSSSWGNNRCTYKLPDLRPAPQFMIWQGASKDSSTGLFIIGHESNGRICNLSSEASLSIDNPKMIANNGLGIWASPFVLPMNEKPGFSATITSLYGRGLKAQISVTVPKYPLLGIRFSAETAPPQGYQTATNFPEPIEADTNGVFSVARDYTPLKPFIINVFPELNIFDPIQGGDYWAPIRHHDFTNAMGPLTEWTSENSTMTSVLQAMKADDKEAWTKRGSLLPIPIVTGNEWQEKALFPDTTIPLAYRSVYRGNGEDQAIEKQVTLHIQAPVVSPALLDFDPGIYKEIWPEKNSYLAPSNIYEGYFVRGMTSDDLKELQVNIQSTRTDKGIGWGQQGFPHFFSVWGDAHYDEVLNITVTNPKLQKQHQGTTHLIPGIADYSPAGPFPLPGETLPPPKANDPRCDDPALTSSGSFAGGQGTEGDPFLVCTPDQLRNAAENAYKFIQRQSRGGLSNMYVPDAGFPAYCADFDNLTKDEKLHCGRDQFRLIANLDFIAISNMSPIDLGGSLDGNGYEIRNPTVVDSLDSKVGLFHRGHNGYSFPGLSPLWSIRNLILRNPTIRGKTAVGGVIGDTEVAGAGLLMENVHVIDGQIWGMKAVGGLIGHTQWKMLHISNCSVRNTLISIEQQEAGGLVGFSEGPIRIEDSLSTAQLGSAGVQGGQKYVGGIIGNNAQSLNLINPLDDGMQENKVGLIRSLFRGTITLGHSANGSFVGGLVGGSNALPIIGSRAEADIAATGRGVGGLIGSWYCINRSTLPCVISHSSFKGTVWGGADRDGASAAGGLVGSMGKGIIVDSVVESGSVIKGISKIGGLVGSASPYTRFYRNAVKAEVGSSQGDAAGFIGALDYEWKLPYQFGDDYVPAPYLSGNTWLQSLAPAAADVGSWESDRTGIRKTERNLDLEGIDAQL